MDSVPALIVTVLLIVGVALAYKNRHTIARWLNDTSLTVTDEKRARYLRYHIAEEQIELEEIDQRLRKNEKVK